MAKIIFVALHLLFYVNARPFKSPDFVSQWFYLQSIPGRERIDVFHHLGEVPDLVQVQVRSISSNNPGFIFPAIGIVPRDDDEIEPRSGIVYLYNEKMVTISAQSKNNHYQGRTIYTENSNYWEGPNNDDSFDCYVRVRAWKTSSMPVPDFHVKNIKIHAACEKGTDCFYEKYHGLKEYPSMVIVRTKLLDVESEFHGFISDAVGSGMMVYEINPIKRNGYVTYGFDSESFRIWTDSSEYGYVFYGEDGTRITGNFRSGELEILAWRSSSLTPTIKETIQLGVSPGVAFDKDKSIPDMSTTEDIIVNLWAEATNGSNCGYRFTGSGALAYTTLPTAFPCSYGGLTYAYTNATIRIWKPGAANIGTIICIPRTFGGGMHTQGSNLAYAKAHIWIPRVSTLNMNCSKPEDCFDIHSFCNNMTCMCDEGYYETDSACEKNLTCTDAVPILPDLQRRARNYVINGSSFSDEFVDDTGLKLSWYSTKDYQMPDVSTLPERNSCGTKYPVYLNGSHPSLNQIGETTLQLNVCYDDCKQTTTIMVRKCAGTMHYQLTRIPVKENAYCFDPPELQNITEFEPVPEVEDFTLNVSVELHFNITYLNEPNNLVTSYDPYLTFNCTIDRYLPKQLFYTTYWYIGSKLFIALGPSNEVQNLTEQMLNARKQKLNVHISCGIKISSTETGLMTKLTKSDEKFFGIKAHTFNETWEGGVVDKFQITTVDKNFADGHQFRLPFQLDDHFHKIWNEHLIDEVMVFVTHNNDYKFKQCYSHVDPHMQTADGYKYENQYEGEFVLYRNFKYGIEVQEKTSLCNKGRAYCACAVAVRAGGDIFLINTCGGLKFIGFTSCNDGGILDIKKRTSLRYQVFTPIGTYIDIQMRPHPSYYDLMNIDVYMAAKDINQTEGLCGFFDNNHNNDLRKRDRHSFIKTKKSKRNFHEDFSQEWRLQPFEHNYLVLSPDNVQSWQAEQRDMFCYCNKSLHNNSDADSSRESSAVCSASIYGNCTQSKYKHTHDLCENTNRRFRRSLPGFITEREMKRRQQLVNKGRKNVSKRNAINQEKITEEYAEKHCSDIITSQISVKQFSHRLKSIDQQQLITDCVYDIMEDNDLSWADVYPGVLNQVIEVYNDRDPEYVKANKEEVAEFTSQSCPLNCSGRGICSSEGDCLCTVGYHGSDCGIRKDDLINIDDIEGGGVCDVIYGDDCQCFHIQTINLLEDFRCQISEISVMVNGSQKLVSTMQSPGNYDDIFNGECCAPLSRTKRSEDASDIFATELEFSISNNGRDFGMATKIYILDSTCQELIIVDNGTFVALKEQTCFISGICRIQNETRFGDVCSVCLSEHNKFDWTETCEAPRKFEGLTLQFILGLCGGLSVALVCIILFCTWKQYRGKYKISVAEYIIYKTEPPKEMDYRYPRPNLNIFRVKNSEEN